MISKKDFEFKQVIFLSAKDGQKVAIKNDNVIITDSSNKVIHQSTCYRLFAVFVVGNISLTSNLIQHARKYGYGIVLMTTTYRPYCFISTNGEGNTLLRQKQYEYNGLGVAKTIICNKVSNQLSILKSIRDKNYSQKEAIISINNILQNIPKTDSIYELMGLEGSASRQYFSAFFDNVEWKQRKPRVKPDMINSLLDIGYTILFGYIESMLSLYGFDLYVGVLHKQFYMRKSLVCDVMEPFRVLIDKCIKKGINRGQFKEEDFKIVNNKWTLKYEKSSAYSGIFINQILDYKDEIFIYVQEFYRQFMKSGIDNNCPEWSE